MIFCDELLDKQRIPQSSAIANRRDKMVPKYRCWFKNSGIQAAHMVEWDKLKEFVGLGRLFDDSKKSTLFTLMQSTGLRDKNGVEIFEGDIVVNQYGNVGYVAYLQQEAGFVVVLKKSDYRLGHRNTGESYDVTTNHEVIGNIHSNPELLEQANES